MHTFNTERIVAHQLRDAGANVKIKSVSQYPNGISGHLCDYDLEGSSSVPHDFDIIDKCRGFLNHDSANFVFIGPDRDLIEFTSIDQCINIANAIQDTGLRNYRQVRIPIRSGLNLQAWEQRLATYPDKFLYQYLKFGFPLSVTNTDGLNNSNVSNHPSALAYPNAVQNYLDKETSCGAMLGPVDHIDSEYYHCSPLLTHPKDREKRRVILNLSYPYGTSVNDKADKLNFDCRHLKFPSIDDVVEYILATDDPVIFKIDVARAFRNLCINPVDALKFGISWQDQLYVDLSVPFGWTHGSAAFQMASDAIAFIMKGMGCKLHPYIDDYVVVAPRHKAQDQFNSLVSLYRN